MGADDFFDMFALDLFELLQEPWLGRIIEQCDRSSHDHVVILPMMGIHPFLNHLGDSLGAIMKPTLRRHSIKLCRQMLGL